MKDAARGVAIGTGILPGVSVGTVGLIVNVYDKLIGSISSLRKDFRKSFLTLLPIAIGCLLSAFALLLFWKKLAYPYFPFPIICLLAGVVLGSLPICAAPLKGVKLSGMDILRLVAGFLVAAGIGVFSFLSAMGIIKVQLQVGAAFDNPFGNAWVFLIVFLVGVIAAIACLIPGISGSMVLFIFGLYNPVVGLLISEKDAAGTITHPSIFHSFDNPGYFWGGILLIVILILGIIIGLVAASKAMKSLIQKHTRGTFTMVLGFVLGSLVSMFFNNDTYEIYTNPSLNVPLQYIIGGVLFIAAAVALFILTKRKTKTPAKSE